MLGFRWSRLKQSVFHTAGRVCALLSPPTGLSTKASLQPLSHQHGPNILSKATQPFYTTPTETTSLTPDITSPVPEKV